MDNLLFFILFIGQIQLFISEEQGVWVFLWIRSFTM